MSNPESTNSRERFARYMRVIESLEDLSQMSEEDLDLLLTVEANSERKDLFALTVTRLQDALKRHDDKSTDTEV